MVTGRDWHHAQWRRVIMLFHRYSDQLSYAALKYRRKRDNPASLPVAAQYTEWPNSLHCQNNFNLLIIDWVS